MTSTKNCLFPESWQVCLDLIESDTEAKNMTCSEFLEKHKIPKHLWFRRKPVGWRWSQVNPNFRSSGRPKKNAERPAPRYEKVSLPEPKKKREGKKCAVVVGEADDVAKIMRELMFDD